MSKIFKKLECNLVYTFNPKGGGGVVEYDITHLKGGMYDKNTGEILTSYGFLPWSDNPFAGSQFWRTKEDCLNSLSYQI